MFTLDSLIASWDEGHREFAIALNGLPDAELWKRGHPCLLSVGEITGHVAYWQAVWLAGGGNDRPDLERLPIKSPLVDHTFRYYTSNVDRLAELPLGTKDVLDELMRVHEAARATVAGKEIDDPYPGIWKTWGNVVQYQAFHVAYHTGQVYSVRHLLGHETEDN